MKWHKENKEYIASYKKKWYEKNKDRLKVYNVNHKDQKKNNKLRFDYDITLEQYNQMLAQQNDCCAICKRHKSLFKKGLDVDHDHLTLKVRELLCGSCNKALGLLQDSLMLLKSATKYIQKHKGNSHEVD